MLNADQLGSAAQQWFVQRPTMFFYNPIVALRHETVGDGPYHIVVVIDAAWTTPEVRNILALFPGVDVPRQILDETHVGEMSLHVLPENVYKAFAFHIGAPHRSLSLQPAPFADPPSEADMGDVLVAAMNPQDWSAFSPARAVRQACDRLGWRAVAALINVMDEATRMSPRNVAAVLTALVCEPAARAATATPTKV